MYTSIANNAMTPVTDVKETLFIVPNALLHFIKAKLLVLCSLFALNAIVHARLAMQRLDMIVLLVHHYPFKPLSLN